MAYDKHTWTCDEPITVERLNHIEDGIANAGGGECGFECEEEWVTLTEESVTTTAQGGYNGGELSYSQFIDADSIKVTFDGAEYECPQMGDGSYGAPYDQSTNTFDWSEYPFNVLDNSLTTETAGTHNIKIEAIDLLVTTTPCFKKAVQSVVPPTDTSPLILTKIGSPARLNRTFEDISNAYLSGRTVLLDPPNTNSLRESTPTKSFHSMVSLTIVNTTIPQPGGRIVFGGETTQIFSASSASDYPVLVTT